jgi:hypothetical protein
LTNVENVFTENDEDALRDHIPEEVEVKKLDGDDKTLEEGHFADNADKGYADPFVDAGARSNAA